MNKEKPPLGIMPKYLWEEERFEELKRCIQSHIDKNLKVDKEWLEEFLELQAKAPFSMKQKLNIEEYVKNAIKNINLFKDFTIEGTKEELKKEQKVFWLLEEINIFSGKEEYMKIFYSLESAQEEFERIKKPRHKYHITKIVESKEIIEVF